jgi:hypothetical protein
MNAATRHYLTGTVGYSVFTITGRRVFEAQLPAQAGFAVGLSARVRVEPAVALQLPAATLEAIPTPTDRAAFVRNAAS